MVESGIEHDSRIGLSKVHVCNFERTRIRLVRDVILKEQE